MTENVGKKILIADDTPAIRKLLSVILTKEGYSLIEAVDGQETLDKVESEQPDLILLDIMMPKKFGWDVLQEVKHRFPQIKIIVMTAVYRKNTYRIATIHDYGADGFLLKPLNIPELLALIKKLLPETDAAGNVEE